MTRELAQEFVRAWTRADGYISPLLIGDNDWSTLWQIREHLVDRAIIAAKCRGRSYRDFQVGAAAFVASTNPDLLRSLGRTPQQIYTGSNWKLAESARNTCAEQEIVSQVRQQEHLFPVRKILALVVAGKPLNEPDRESGVTTEMLHPCNHCRHLLGNVPCISGDTIIVTVDLENTRREILFFDDLLEIHGMARLGFQSQS